MKYIEGRMVVEETTVLNEGFNYRVSKLITVLPFIAGKAQSVSITCMYAYHEGHIINPSHEIVPLHTSTNEK